MTLKSSIAQVSVCIQTDIGDFVLQLRRDLAPISTDNFLEYIGTGLFNPGLFYRSIGPANDRTGNSMRLIQGGLAPTLEHPLRLPSITHESTIATGLTHRRGAVSLARTEPGTACSEFFIVLDDAPYFDAGSDLLEDRLGYAAFGHVVEGLEVADAINRLPTGTTYEIPFMHEQALTPGLEFVATIL